MPETREDEHVSLDELVSAREILESSERMITSLGETFVEARREEHKTYRVIVVCVWVAWMTYFIVRVIQSS